MITRRNFIKSGSILAGGLALASQYSCSWNGNSITGNLSGANSTLGHKLRDHVSFGEPKETHREDIVIVGGGVAGLSAARWLKKDKQSFKLLELESEVGGNSRYGSNSAGKFPLGAHYLPIPDIKNNDLISFLEECEVITGYQNGLPVYNEYYLCFDPKERLYINHHWQEGLIPNEGVPGKDQNEINRFIQLMDHYRNLKGADGKDAFSIPVSNSSQDPTLLALDKITMHSFLGSNDFHSPYLTWYVNYCCADDYGASLHDTSAWAGIHYFASRKGRAVNAKSDDVLTWPEGNGWLVKQLTNSVGDHIQKGALVTAVRQHNNQVHIDYFDTSRNELRTILAKAVIMATPQFLNKYLLQVNRAIDYTQFEYAPWMVANLTVNSQLQEKRGEQICWDNVIYDSNSLGYVNSQHQEISIPLQEKVITYYYPLTGTSCSEQRNKINQHTWKDWGDLIFKDLSRAHPEIKNFTSNMDIHIWGHGMIRPSPGFIWGDTRKIAGNILNNRIYFAHSDLGGISVFEEAFGQGIQAARNLLING